MIEPNILILEDLVRDVNGINSINDKLICFCYLNLKVKLVSDNICVYKLGRGSYY